MLGGTVLFFKKPGLDGLALAFEILSRAKAIIRPSLWLGLAWLGPWPEARPSTALKPTQKFEAPYQ